MDNILFRNVSSCIRKLHFAKLKGEWRKLFYLPNKDMHMQYPFP